MNEKMSSSSEDLNNSFNEDFDFGETSETSTLSSESPAPAKLNKKVLGISLFLLFPALALTGYRFYKTHALPSKAAPVPQNSAHLAPRVPAPALPKEPPMADIADAFREADKAPGALPVQSHAPEPNIQELHQALFTPASPVASTPKATEPTPSQSAELSEGLSKLNQQIEYILSQIKYLDAYTREVSDNLNKLNDALGAMDSRLSTLTSTTSSLTQDVGSVKNEVGHVKKVLKDDGLDLVMPPSAPLPAVSDKVSTPTVDYIVHAVIPGRAWLKSSKGQIITVAEGDTLGQYGKILVIDAANGVVLTSSGASFR